ncbi:NAD(P)-binding protein [Demequina silvatica]|uniref:NAD(P)-binding protein n=1 Tax=Demequina silvatica TaxID=1638988 RepID=UPI0007803429|nr:NAD(P)-binding protein [Demequina silvatica]
MIEDWDVDHLVVGAGATGLAFADALVDHGDASVALIDTRPGPGGHWRDAYPFVRLHQASLFYGVASTRLGGGIQQSGPERGLHERATGAEVRAYFEAALARLEGTGRVIFRGGVTHRGGGVVDAEGTVVARTRRGTRIVDAHHLAPTVPAVTPPPFTVEGGAAVVPVGKLDEHLDARRIVVVGSGKTATDAVVHALEAGVPPDRLTWVRPRDPWMLDRARIQPEPAVFQTMAADVWEAAAGAGSLTALFARLEEAGVMLRIDRSVTPTMAKAPTLARWELELLRSVEDVVRLGHVHAAAPGRLVLERGEVALPARTVILHCAADGLPHPPAVPVWSPEAITLQPIRAGFPCFGAALIGYVEATRSGDDAKNALCPPTQYGNTRAQWAEMTLRGAASAAAFMGAEDVREWARGVALNPARVPRGYASPALDEARERIARSSPAALSALARLAVATA